jgi:IS1 family transposase
VSLSATARVTGHSRNTVARWLERASTAATRFNDRMLRGFDLIELQADELCTFVGNKNETVWLFATLEVSSRLWAGSVLGRRSDHNARAVINDVVRRGRVVGCPLIATDGFEYYIGAVGDLVGPACVYGQVLKTRRNNRVIRVERRVKIGTASRLQAALWASEDSQTLNTSFVERLNLTIRQASAYLPALALPRPWRRPAPKPRRARALPLQLRPTAQSVTVRPRNPDTSHASWSGEHAPGLERHLHNGPRHSADVCGGRRNWLSRVTKALVAARPTNGGLIKSERRKHPFAEVLTQLARVLDEVLVQ